MYTGLMVKRLINLPFEMMMRIPTQGKNDVISHIGFASIYFIGNKKKKVTNKN
jgi:hypothetical protein